MKRLNQLITFFALLLFLGCGHEAFAQPYKNAIGLRLGYPASISYKHFLTESNAVEVNAGTRGWATYRWLNVSGAYLIHNDIESAEGLEWYYGAGASLYFWNYGNQFIGDTSSNMTVGIQGYLGLEYTLVNAPVSFTLDWVPTFFFSGFTRGFGGGYGSLGIRYILAR